MSHSRICIAEPHCSNLQEVMRHIAANQDHEVVNQHRFGAKTLVDRYISHYEDDFSEKEGGQYIFEGGDSVKSSATDTEEIKEVEETDDKWSFSMSEME